MNLIAIHLAFVFLTMVAIKEAVSSNVKVGNHLLFTSEKGLRVTYLEKTKDEKNKCVQKIKVTFPQGGTINEVSVKCVNNLREKTEGEKYFVGKVLYSDGVDGVYVINENDECISYQNIPGKTIEPFPREGQFCDTMKEKLRNSGSENDDIATKITDGWEQAAEYLYFLNPWNLSTMEGVMKLAKKFM